MSRLADVASRWKALDWRADVGLALLAGIGYAILAHLLFAGRPTGLDEAVAIWQAKLLWHGQLAAPVPPHPEAVLTRLTGIGPAGIIGQFSLGTVLLLVPFVAIGQLGLAGPVYGAIGIFCWARLVRRIEGHAPTALAAVLLLAVSPFWAIQSTSQLAHVPTVTLMFAIGLALARLLAPTPSPRAGVWLGLLVGVAAMVRPVEALAAAAPAALLVLWLVARGRLPRRVIGQGLLGVAAPLTLLLATNNYTTGAPLRFGYDLVSGPKHQLGFHEGPDGTEYTPMRGALKVRRQLRGLGEAAWQSRLTPLWPAALGAVLAIPAITLLEGWFFATVLGVLAAYWAYWGNAVWLGPRFMLPLLPFLLLGVARVPRFLGRWHRLLGAAAALIIAAAVVDGVLVGTPPVFRAYGAMRRPVTTNLTPLLIGTPRPGLIIARGDVRRGNEGRLRAFTGNVGNTNPIVKGANQCEVLWMVRWLEAGVQPAPPIADAWREWCAGPDFFQRHLVTSDLTGAILRFGVSNRPILADLGARTALLADSTTFRTQTRLLLWERIGMEQWRPRLAAFDYDSARADWAREDSAFALGRRQVGR